MSESPNKKTKSVKRFALTSASTASVMFSALYESEKYKLVEAPNEVTDAVLKGELVCMKGTQGLADAVICTTNKTYSIKKVETSNAVFLVPSATSDRYDINSKASEYYEVKLIEPCFAALKRLLQKSEYKGLDEEKEYPPDQKDLYTREALESLILCSKVELDSILKDLRTIEIEGFIRTISFKVIHNVHRAIIDTIIEHDWDFRNIDRNLCLQELPDVEILLIDHSLSM